jgi:hypothetical protein
MRHLILRVTAGAVLAMGASLSLGSLVVRGSVRAPSVTVSGSIVEMKAEAGRAIVQVESGPVNNYCADVIVWTPATRKILAVLNHRCGLAYPYESFYGAALAKDNAAYVHTSEGNILESYLVATSLATGRSSNLAAEYAGGQGSWGNIVTNAQGHGNLLVYNDHKKCLKGPDVTPPDVACPPGIAESTIVSDQIRLALPTNRAIATSDHQLTLLAVGGGRVIIAQQTGPIIVLSPQPTPTGLVAHAGFRAERLIATYQYKPHDVLAAATDGRTLALLRRGALDVIPLPGNTGTRKTHQLPRATSYGPDRPVACNDWGHCQTSTLRLTDLDGNIAVFIRSHAVYLLNLTTSHNIIFASPTAGPVNAQLEPDGLYISAGNRLTFTPRTAVEKRLQR